MDIYQLSLNEGSVRLLGEQEQAAVASRRARIFFAGFAQDGEVLAQLMSTAGAAAGADAPVQAVKKVYGMVAKEPPIVPAAAAGSASGAAADAATASGDGGVAAGAGAACAGSCSAMDLYVVCNYSLGLDGAAVAKGSDFDVTMMDCSALRELCARYEALEIIAWSFGVRVVRALAERIEQLRRRIVYAVALNGTVLSVDMNFGIDPPVYDATLERFSPVMHKHFVKNMCTYACAAEIGVEQIEPADDSAIYRVSTEQKAMADQVRSRRSVDEFRCELKFMPFVQLSEAPDTAVISQDFSSLDAAPFYFDEAWVALGDVIIPPAAQYHYWHNYGLMRLSGQASSEDSAAPAAGFTLKLIHAAHLCPALMRQLMDAPPRQRPAIS